MIICPRCKAQNDQFVDNGDYGTGFCEKCHTGFPIMGDDFLAAKKDHEKKIQAAAVAAEKDRQSKMKASLERARESEEARLKAAQERAAISAQLSEGSNEETDDDNVQ